MTMFRTLLASVLLIGAYSVAAAEQGTTDEQSACKPDVRRFCFKVHESDGPNAYLQCLQFNRQRLSARCRAVLESHGV